MSSPEGAASSAQIEKNLPTMVSVFSKVSHAFLSLPSLLETRIFKRNAAESRHRHWNVTRYFELVSDERYQSWGKMHSLLEKDYITFTDEAVVPKYKTGPYEFTPTGLPNSYKDESQAYSQGFIDQQHVAPNRAEIEAKKWQELENWLHQAKTDGIPIGQSFIWFSPRGSVAEGYLGKESTNPNLISVYVKTENGVEMTQFKTWSSLKQLKATIRLLGYKYSKNFLDASHNCIASSGVAPKLQTLSEIEAHIYASEKSEGSDTTEKGWPITKDHLPVVDEEEFNTFRSEVFEAYSQFLLSFMFKFVENDSKFNPKTKAKTIFLLDTFFSIAVKTLEGWVYYNDQRSDKSMTYASTLTSTVKKDSKAEGLSDTEHANSETVRAILKQLFYQLEAMTFDPNSVTEENMLSLNRLSNMLMLNIPMRLFSLGQCISMAIPSAMVSSMVKFNGGMLPDNIAISEGWLDRKGICARGDLCVSHLKGLVQNLGPCDWCFDCDGRFSHIRELGKLDYRLFKPRLSNDSSSNPLTQGATDSSQIIDFNRVSPLPQKSIGLTEFLAGDYAAA